MSQECGFSTSGICCDNCKELAVSCIGQPSQGFRHGRGFIQFLYRDITDKWHMFHFKKRSIHDPHHPFCSRQTRSHLPGATWTVPVSFPGHPAGGKIPLLLAAWIQGGTGSYYRKRLS